MSDVSIRVTANIQALATEAAHRIQEAALSAIQSQGVFTIALSGGSTPRTLYHLLAGEPCRSAINWSKVRFYFGDERCVPPDHPDSNYGMAEKALLSQLPIPRQNIHRMRGEIEPMAAAAEYEALLEKDFGDGGLDMILLGMGDDGHTASIFPESPAVLETKHRCVAIHVPKLKSWRITMTAPFINRAGHILILAAGSSKARRLHEVLEGPRDPMRLPIQLIHPFNGRLNWILDAEAAGMM